jgi:hypothetical protein
LSRGKFRLIGGLLAAAALIALVGPIGSAAARPPLSDGGPSSSSLVQPSGSAPGLDLHLVGLPATEQGRLTLVGLGFQRGLSIGPHRHLRLRPGRYVIRVLPVTMSRAHGDIEQGAVAQPIRRRFRIKVGRHRHAALDIRYGTIVNPGVRDVTGAIVSLEGGAATPSAVTLKAGTPVQAGQVLSAQPGPGLPQGLLARVASVGSGPQGDLVHLKPVGIYEVAPNMSFDVPLTTTASGTADASKLISCNVGELGPYSHISDFHVSGGWTTARVLGVSFKTGAQVELHYRVSAGLKLTLRAGVHCSLSLPEVGLQGMAGPIPVYGGFRPTAEAEVGGAATFHSGGSLGVTTGLKVGGVPPAVTPIVSFSSPQFEFGSETFSGAKASLGLDAEIGIGAEDAANLHADLGNDLSFTATSGQCSWDLDLGTFSATGELGPFSISTPKTKALYHHNLWHSSCGSSPPPPAPAPAPSPPPPPAPVVPPLGSTLVYTGDSGLSPFFGDFEFEDWSAATGQPVAVTEFLPPTLSGYRCVALLVNRSFTPEQEQALAAYLQQGGSVFAIGEHESDFFEDEGPGFDEADAALNALAGSLGVGMSLDDNGLDYGHTVTSNIVPSPLTAGVGLIGDDWVSSISLSGTAQPLVETNEESLPVVAYQPVASGTFIMSGDSNMFTDNSEGFYDDYDNGRLVANLCP